jgi:uncharacterized protein (TIGR02145 family)
VRIFKNFYILILGSLIYQACDKGPASIDYEPVAEFTIKPESGNTTTIFEFDASSSLKESLEDNPVFLRWDWDSDGTFDKMYTSGEKYSHRFFQKGNYRITLEAATLLGRKDTVSLVLDIPQGYSPPRAAINIIPDSANIFTEFVFDASGSKDDEDSLDQLKFRWDFDGDGQWDTEFLSDPEVIHKFDDNKYYDVGLEVKDPQDMINKTSTQLIVTRLNDRISPHMIYECWPCTMEDTFKFDASASYVKDDPDARILFSWNVNNNDLWEVHESESPLFSFSFPSAGIRKLKLRVTDKDGLYMDSVYEIETFPFNTPPFVDLVLGNPYGNTSTEFYLHGRGSWDRESSYLDLKVRWDLDDDGRWEEEWNDKFEVWIKFDKPGKYPVAMKITDTQDKSVTDYDTIRVYAGHHETGLLEDKRAGYIPDYYGTVLIGNNWWTQNNSRYIPPQGNPLPPGSYNVYAYKNETDSVYKYGYLYPYQAIFSKFSPCPKGWRVPSLDDWNQLMEDLEPDNSISDLLLGGSSELHIQLTGQQAYGNSNGKGRMVNYYTSTTTTQGHPYLWYFDKLLGKNQSVIASSSYHLPVRCVKD